MPTLDFEAQDNATDVSPVESDWAFMSVRKYRKKKSSEAPKPIAKAPVYTPVDPEAFDVLPVLDVPMIDFGQVPEQTEQKAGPYEQIAEALMQLIQEQQQALERDRQTIALLIR